MPRKKGIQRRTGPRKPMRKYKQGEKAKWCFAVSGGRVVCNNSTNSRKPRKLKQNNVWNRKKNKKGGWSSIQEQRRLANKRYLKRKKTGTVRKVGSRTGVKYRKRR